MSEESATDESAIQKYPGKKRISDPEQTQYQGFAQPAEIQIVISRIRQNHGQAEAGDQDHEPQPPGIQAAHENAVEQVGQQLEKERPSRVVQRKRRVARQIGQ